MAQWQARADLGRILFSYSVSLFSLGTAMVSLSWHGVGLMSHRSRSPILVDFIPGADLLVVSIHTDRSREAAGDLLVDDMETQNSARYRYFLVDIIQCHIERTFCTYFAFAMG